MKKQSQSSKAASVSSKKAVRERAKSKAVGIKDSDGSKRPVSKAAVSTRKTSAGSLTVMASGEFAIGTTTVEKEPAKKGWFRRFFGVKQQKPRLLWIGDALVPTGFATVTHAVLNHLQHEWDVVVSGINYDGSEHELP